MCAFDLIVRLIGRFSTSHILFEWIVLEAANRHYTKPRGRLYRGRSYEFVLADQMRETAG